MNDALAIGVVMGVILFYVIIIGLGIASYIIGSLSLYTMAKRRQIAKPGIVWIPFLGNWIMGSLADDIDAKRGIARNWRTVMLSLAIIVLGTVILMYIISGALMVSVVMMGNAEQLQMPDGEMLGLFIIMYAIMIVMALALTTLRLLQCICIYKLYEDIKPEKALKYMLISILVPLGYPICLLKCKDKIELKQAAVVIDEPSVEEL